MRVSDGMRRAGREYMAKVTAERGEAYAQLVQYIGIIEEACASTRSPLGALMMPLMIAQATAKVLRVYAMLSNLPTDDESLVAMHKEMTSHVEAFRKGLIGGLDADLRERAQAGQAGRVQAGDGAEAGGVSEGGAGSPQA